MKKLFFLIVFLFPFNLFAQTFHISLFDFSFFEHQDLECCDQILEGEKAPYQAYLIKPYQLVIFRDTLDNLHKDMAAQLKHQDLLCENKISLYKTQCDQIVEDVKAAAAFYEERNISLEKQNNLLIKENFKYKLVMYIALPLTFAAGLYTYHLVK